MKEKSDQFAREYELCKEDNEALKSYIKRYQKMIAERENIMDECFNKSPLSKNSNF